MNLLLSVDGHLGETEAVSESRSRAFREVNGQIMDALAPIAEAAEPFTREQVRTVVEAVLADANLPTGTTISLDFESRKWR